MKTQKTQKTSRTDKVLSRIPAMDSKKVEHWIRKTTSTMNNTKDSSTQAYWKSLTTRYTALAERAKVVNIWNNYCQSTGLPVDHEPTAVLK